MKKLVLFIVFIMGVSVAAQAQSGKERSGGKFSGLFKGGKRHKQMQHFDQPKTDPNIKSNGTSYWRNRKRDYVVDGDGFGTAKQGKSGKRRRKK